MGGRELDQKRGNGMQSRSAGDRPTVSAACSVAINPTWHREVTAVTGTIASGKSTFVSMLRDRGASIVSADELAREVVAPGSEGLQAVVAEFGNEIVDKSGELDRRILGRMVFSDADKRRRLEAILHPRIASLAAIRFGELIAQGKRPLVYEVPLLFEAGLDACGFKNIVVVTANDDLCMRRQLARNPEMPEFEARARIKAQIPIEVKRQREGVIIVDNSGSKEDLDSAAAKIFARL